MLRIAKILECNALNDQEKITLAYLYDLQGISLHTEKYKIKNERPDAIRSLIEKGLIVNEPYRFNLKHKNIVDLVRSNNGQK